MSTNTQELNSVYFARLHWVVFLGPVTGILLSMALGAYIAPLRWLSLFLGAFSLIWVMMTWVTYYFSSLTIQKKQVILRTGLVIRQTVDIPLSKIETIDIRQSLLGSLFRYGALVITGTGGTRHLINYLEKPLTCRRYIEQAMND